MDQSALRFARRVLLAHLLGLAIVIVIVYFAAREVYQNTRELAIEQAKTRQRLLAGQTARGIESFYSSILADLDLLGRYEQQRARPETAVLFLGPALWNQLEGRVTQLLVIDRADNLNLVQWYGQENPISPQQVITAAEGWLRGVDGPAVSRYFNVEQTGLTLAAVPVSSESRRLLVAVVPVRAVETRFLDDVNQQATMSATLLDESMAMMATSDPSLVGLNVLASLDDPNLRAMVQQYVQGAQEETQIIEEPIRMGDVTLTPRLVTAEPIELSGQGGKWSLLIASYLGDVDAVVSHAYRNVFWWAMFVIVSVTAILVSTAVQLIRGRVRLERLQHELLTRELTQARQIQLAWLPDQTNSIRLLDIAALNLPASHISGDFYNWFELEDGRTVVTIGDVTGHGMAAAFLMATTQLLVRNTMPRVNGDPGRCLEEVNRQLLVQMFNGQFVTMMLIVIDVENGTIEVANAGHPPALISTGKRFQRLAMKAQLVMGIEECPFITQRFELASGSTILLYTDGVIEAPSPAGERMGVEGLEHSLFGRYENAQTLVDSVVQVVEQFRAGRELPDDLTLVAIQLQGTADAPEHLVELGKRL